MEAAFAAGIKSRDSPIWPPAYLVRGDAGLPSTLVPRNETLRSSHGLGGIVKGETARTKRYGRRGSIHGQQWAML